jgi:hypothetical protein
LTDLDSNDETHSLVHTIRFASDDSKAKLQKILKDKEFNLRKRKAAANLSMRSSKRSMQSAVPVERPRKLYNKNMSAGTAAGPEINYIASHDLFDTDHKSPLPMASEQRSQSFLNASPTQEKAQGHRPMETLMFDLKVQDSNEGASISAGTSLNSHIRSAIPSNNDYRYQPAIAEEDDHLPMDKAYSNEITLDAAHRSSEYQQEPGDVTIGAPLQLQPFDEFRPWEELTKRRAKRSRLILRPALGKGRRVFLVGDHQSMAGITSRPLSAIRDLTSQQGEILASVDDKDDTGIRKLMRRTYVHVPSTQASDYVTSTAPTSKSTSTQPRLSQTPYTDTHSYSPTQQSASNSDGSINAVDPDPAPVCSALIASGPTLLNKQTARLDHVALSAQLIANHFPNEFVKFTIPGIDGLAENKWMKLADCYDVTAMHQTVIDRFRHPLAGRLPSEIVFILTNESFAIEADDCGQRTWDEFVQTVVDSAPPGTCPITASVSL